MTVGLRCNDRVSLSLCVCHSGSAVNPAVCHSRDLSCGIKTTSLGKKRIIKGLWCCLLHFLFCLFFCFFSPAMTKRCLTSCITFSSAFLLAVSGLHRSPPRLPIHDPINMLPHINESLYIFSRLEIWQSRVLPFNFKCKSCVKLFKTVAP